MIHSVVEFLETWSVFIAAELSGGLLAFIFFYPLYMSFIWMIGGIYFYWRHERNTPGPTALPTNPNQPFVSILIPCFNEHAHAAETIAAAAEQNYPNFEIIAIDDGSSDDTGDMLDRMLKQYPMLRVLRLAKNQGKAMALRMGAMVARSEYLLCIDGDALLHPNATAHIIQPLLYRPRVGAVTGNPRIRTRSTLLGKVQVGEFSSIIGLIKRAQRVYGNVFTVSGVIVCYRKSALHRSGYWSLDVVTEDIDASWMLQVDHWSIQYEPNALCWILMPETFKGLWSQRLRWAQGGAEVFLKQIRDMNAWKRRRMWGLVIEYCSSLVWSYALLFSFVLWGVGQFIDLPEGLNVPSIEPPRFWGLLLATTCVFQFTTALVIESRYEKSLWSSMVFTIWYPFFFWILTLLTAVVGFPKALFENRSKRATWVSPDRGVASSSTP